jgi:predicted ArsR family transcriptional regulator
MLEYLRSHEKASAIDLSAALSLTVPDIRHHLAALIEQGWVITAGRRAITGRGRPTMLYRLSSRAFGSNLEALSAALLDVLLENEDGMPVDERLRQVAGRLAASFPAQNHHSLTRRLTETVHRLNAMSYQARWEARAGGPLIYLEHCPYGSLIDRHPAEVRLLNQFLVEILLGRSVKLLPSPNPSHLVFAVLTPS